MNIIFCDECKMEFRIEPKEEEIKDRISKVYFNCPHCNKEYISYYTSALVKIKQNKIQKIKEQYIEAREKEPKTAERLFKQFQKLRKEIGKDMENLRKRIEDMKICPNRIRD